MYSTFIYKRDYARFLPEENRREEWVESVMRYQRFFSGRLPYDLVDEFNEAIAAVVDMDVMPSMRCLWSAGPALENDNIAGYNCAYTVIDSIHSFAEVLYILMNGAGVGFSTERQYINKLPDVSICMIPYDVETVVFEDSKLGWAKGYERLLQLLFAGLIPKYDLSLIRPKGAVLKTFGGRASGPEPLKDLIEFTIKVFKGAQGRKLKSIEVYDIVCMIANCVVSGGVRRSATINLSNPSDDRMRHAKEGQFWIDNPQRQLSNNSVAYTEKPEMMLFMDEWLSLMRSGTGERGIFNREGAVKAAVACGREPRDFGTNPCGEILLRPRQFCNLTEVVVRPYDTYPDLIRKVKMAVRLGVLQSTLTDFQFLDPEWKKNCEEERLLGVSLTGIMDHHLLNTSRTAYAYLVGMKKAAHEEASRWANVLGINVPKAVTCVKPSGTVSQLVGTSSGLHARHSPYYIRRVRVNASDPVAHLLQDAGVPCSPEVGQDWTNLTTLVFEFPMRSPESSVFRYDRTAIEQLELWRTYKEAWCDHNPSFTVYVKEDEWLEVGAWVYRNWDKVCGLSFLPYDGGVYSLAPYQEITAEEYIMKTVTFPVVDFDNLPKYERQDNTSGTRTYACTGDKCEL